jgi:hypothetical protein
MRHRGGVALAVIWFLMLVEATVAVMIVFMSTPPNASPASAPDPIVGPASALGGTFATLCVVAPSISVARRRLSRRPHLRWRAYYGWTMALIMPFGLLAYSLIFIWAFAWPFILLIAELALATEIAFALPVAGAMYAQRWLGGRGDRLSSPRITSSS